MVHHTKVDSLFTKVSLSSHSLAPKLRKVKSTSPDRLNHTAAAFQLELHLELHPPHWVSLRPFTHSKHNIPTGELSPS